MKAVGIYEFGGADKLRPEVVEAAGPQPKI